MKRNKMILFVWVNFIGIALSCKRDNLQPKVLTITHYKLMVNDPVDPITILTLLHAYPMAKQKDNNLPIANLYVCKKNNSKDSMFVFDVNKPNGKSFLDNDYKGQGFIINSVNIKSIKTKSVVINVPPNFIIPIEIEYVFARIDQTSD